MSDKINDGGPAFPVPDFYEQSNLHHNGLSLRDWFAGQAMAAMVSSYRKVMRGRENAQDESEGDLSSPDRDLLLDRNSQTGEYEGAREVASDAYAIADAMLKAREAK